MQGTAEYSETKSDKLGAAADFLQKYRWAFVSVLLAFIAIAATSQSAVKLFWWDELASYDVAKLPHAADVWSFFRAGLDTPSPVPTLIVQATLHLIGATEVLARLPFEIGFLLMCLCLYGVTARRYSAGYALAALILPALMGAFYFASELRTYGIVLGAVSVSLYCWQNVERRGPTRILGLLGIFAGLALSILCHAFAIFVMVPFTVAQFTRDWRARRIDIPVWIAMLLAPMCLVIELPGMHAAHQFYGSSFWAKPNLSAMIWSYSYALGTLWMIAVILLLLAFPTLQHRFAAARTPGIDRGFSVPEWVMIALLAAQPLIAWPFSHFLGVYVARYTIALTIGVTLLIVAGIAEATKRNRLAGFALALAFFIAFAQDKHRMISEALHSHQTLAAQLQQQPWIKVLEESSLPVIAPNTPVYTQLQHYASPALEPRLYYTLNTPSALRLDEDPGAELSMKLFSTRLQFLRVQEFSTFTQQHPSFLILVESPLPPASNPGNYTTHLIGSYKAPEKFGVSYFSVYQVDVNSQ